jgi:hypothetical protein
VERVSLAPLLGGIPGCFVPELRRYSVVDVTVSPTPLRGVFIGGVTDKSFFTNSAMLNQSNALQIDIEETKEYCPSVSSGLLNAIFTILILSTSTILRERNLILLSAP